MEIALLYDMGVIVLAATFLAIVAKLFRQPLIPAYIIAGILIGPHGLKLITNQDLVTTLSEIGIALLLFIVGMEMDFSKLKNVGLVSSLGTILQLGLTFLGGFMFSYALGFNFIESLYISIIVSFSSTMIVIKLLSDRDQLDTLSGRIALGILLVQDIIVVIVMSFLVNMNSLNADTIFMTLFKAIGLFSIAIVFNKYIFPPLLKEIVKDKELFFMASLSICFLFASLAFILGFSIAIGGFLAGISLAVFPYNLDISSRVKSLRDFFTILFFGSLGMTLTFHNFSAYLYPLAVLSLFVVVGKFFIVSIITSFLGYKRRVAVFSGLNLANVSEFSLILAGTGYVMGHISGEIVSLATMLALISISISSYTIKYDERIYGFLSPFLAFMDKVKIFKNLHKLSNVEELKGKLRDHVVIIGAHTMGQTIIDKLKSGKQTFIVLDYNPEIIKKLIERGIYCVYGDINHYDIIEDLQIRSAKLIISTIPRLEDNSLLLERVKIENPKAKVIVSCVTIDEAIKLYSLGADFVIIPKLVGAERVSNYLKSIFEDGDTTTLDRVKIQEIKYLERKSEEDYIYTYGPEYLKELKEKIERG